MWEKRSKRSLKRIMDKIRNAYCFDDILLSPSFSDIASRSDVSLTSYLDANIALKLPIISSPMDTVTESRMASAMSRMGGLGIIHRYNSIEEQSELVRLASRDGRWDAGASIGVTGDFIDRAISLVNAGANIICVDIAHGHHEMMRYALGVLRNTFGSKIHIMEGNVATLDGFNDLADWGADSIKVGIGGGSICSTRIQTGHGIPTFQSILDCSHSDRDAKIIADGGIRNSGDIVKALAAGADFVMLGSILSGATESPGSEILLEGEKYKAYRGMSSKDAQIAWRGHTSSLEGVSSMVPVKGDVREILHDLERGIRSGLSYSGARDIFELQGRASFIIQTSSGAIESSTHINLQKKRVLMD